MSTKATRYPGAGPFSESQYEVFFGRKGELEYLQQLLGRKQQVMLYSKSGVGKSSLIQAGLIPVLNEQAWRCIKVRFYPNAPKAASPLERLLNAIPRPEIAEYLTRFLPQDEDNLWIRFKSDQAKNPAQILLIFDQFEELFTYSLEQILEFKQELAKLIYETLPNNYGLQLRAAIAENSSLLTEDEFDLLYDELNIKVLVAIREDRLSGIHQVADYLPDLQHNYLEIKPLKREQARKAIVEPARAPGEFVSQPFDFDEAAIERILDHLTQSGTQPVETTQLQIICQKIVAVRITLEKISRNTIYASDLPSFHGLLRDFYLGVLAKVPKDERAKTSRFIEKGLIHEGHRIPVAESLCASEIGRAMLGILVEHHLLRAEHNSTGGLSYELSHDILVEPILEEKALREAEESQAAWHEEQAELVAELQAAEAARLVERRKLWRTRRLAGIAFLFLVSAIFLWIDSRNIARNLKEKSKSLEAQIRVSDSLKNSLQLAVEGYEFQDSMRKSSEFNNWVRMAQSDLRAKEYFFADQDLDSAEARHPHDPAVAALRDTLNRIVQ